MKNIIKNSKSTKATFKLLISILIMLLFTLSSVNADDDDPNDFQNIKDVTQGFQKVENVQDTCGGGAIDPKDSLIMSAVTLCIPGLLEKTNEFKQYQCQQVQCYFDAVSNNLDPSFCAENYARQTCEFILGEAFAIPPMALLDYYRDIVKQLIENPVGIAFSAVATAGRNFLSTACPGPSCTGPVVAVSAVGLFIIDATAAYDIIDGIRSGEKSLGESLGYYETQDYCENLGSIEEEMTKILEVMSN